MAQDYIIELKNCSKVYPGVTALSKVNANVIRGKVNGLVGENGAGKTTLLNIVNGTVQKSEGEIFIDKKVFNTYTNTIAKQEGILTVTQHVQLFPELTIAENIFFNEVNPKTKLINYKLLYQRCDEIFREINFDYNPKEKVRNLNYVDQQMIEILKVVYSKNQKVIILDEPTAALPVEDVELLFNFIRRLRERKVTFLYVSHRLEEIFQICDYVTVLRDGKKILDDKIENLDMESLINAMVGKDVELYPQKECFIQEKTVLEVKGITKEPFLRNVSFNVKQGEILGIAGLRGSGNTTITKILSGLEIASEGKILINNRVAQFRAPHDSREAGIGYLSNNRFKYGIIPIRSVRENIAIGLFKKIISSLRFILLKTEKKLVQEYIKHFDIKTPSTEAKMSNLSGGNQQKSVLAKLIGGDYPILVMEEPTFGVDVNVKAEIHRIMIQIVRNGSSIVLTGDDFMELTKMCDRILVLKKGNISNQYQYGEINDAELTEVVGGKDAS